MVKLILISFILIGCNQKFEWSPAPWAADSATQALYSSDVPTQVIKANEPAFNDMICFTSQNILELKQAIEKLNIYQQNKSKPEVRALMNDLNRAAKLPPEPEESQYTDMN